MNRNVWYSPQSDINSPDTVHQTLMYGSLKDIKNLKNSLKKEDIKKIFLNHPKKIYTASTLNFIKNMILRIKTPIDEQKYLKFTPRNIR